MAKKLQVALSFLVLSAAVFWSFYGTSPHKVRDGSAPETVFSTERAFEHVKAIAREPHYTGSSEHRQVRNYIVSQLQDMGLVAQTQEGFSLNKYGTITRPQNILSRIDGQGSGKAVLLLTHYDSAMHSSPGASDAASGVAAILEGVRAFLASGKQPLNDIILVFSDAEELGLNGADLFVQEHPWAKEVGVAINFEARGSGGNSFMLMETNGGNSAMIKEFMRASPEYPVSNSLAYSVYKLLPNDTDLTVLREQGNISGYNFAFIDDHFDYHTANDTPENLDRASLAHQGSYLVPLLQHFAGSPMVNLETSEDVVFFTVPIFNLVSYPYSWIYPMLLLAGILLVGLLIYGVMKRRLRVIEIFKSFLPLLLSLLLAGILAWAMWQFSLYIYPQYGEMEHGFTYNGYYYIAAVIFLSLGVTLYSYSIFQRPDTTHTFLIAPLLTWILLSAGTATFLKGASYFIVPVYFGLIQLFLLISQKKPKLVLLAFLSIPALFLLLPFVVTFPVALGLKVLYLSAVLTVLLFVLLWPVFGFYRKNQSLGFLSILIFLGLFLTAHFKSEFNEERPKPNSLVYLYDADSGSATWNTYDRIHDSWTETYFNAEAEDRAVKALFSSKYGSGFTRSVQAPQIDLAPPQILQEKLSAAGEEPEEYRIKIIPQRDINRIELFADRTRSFETFKVNGLEAPDLRPGESNLHVFRSRWSDRLLTYYAVNRDTLLLEFSIPAGEKPDIILYEASHDLNEPRFNVAPREKWMIPRPFVLNDASIIKQTIHLE